MVWKRVPKKKNLGDGIREVDRLIELPDWLLHEILLNLSTKDVIKTSILSTKWRNIWSYVPGLDLDYSDFPDVNTFVSFIDRFLSFNSGFCIHNFMLEFDWEKVHEPDLSHFTRWINIVVERKVQHLHVFDATWDDVNDEYDEVEIPPTVYACESLVSLELSNVKLANTPEFVSLPRVKDIVLDGVLFENDLAFEKLISGCPVLESLALTMNYAYDVKLLRVCSKSLLSFTYTHHLVHSEEDLVVEIDAPKLRYLKLYDYLATSFVINSPGSLVEVDMVITFNLWFGNTLDPNDILPRRNIIRNFLIGISSVKVMSISTRTLEVIYNYSRCERLPIFRNLSYLHVDFYDSRWEMLPIFIESCPNLKSLDLEFNITRKVSMLHEPQCFLPSLEYVKIVRPMAEEPKEMELVSYFLKKSPNLKEFTFFLGYFRKNQESEIREKLLAIPRLSTLCQVILFTDH